MFHLLLQRIDINFFYKDEKARQYLDSWKRALLFDQNKILSFKEVMPWTLLETSEICGVNLSQTQKDIWKIDEVDKN